MLASAINKSSKPINSFVCASGVGYYKLTDEGDQKEYDENWLQPIDPNQRDFWMKLVRDWEKASELDEQTAPETRRVVIRPGLVLGGDDGVFKRLRLPFTLGLGGVLGSGRQWLPWIHVEDLASMFKFALTNEHVSGVINGVAPQQITNQQFTDALGKALKRPTIIPSPAIALRLLFGQARADLLIRGQRVKSRAELLGFRYSYPNIQAACDRCVATA